MHSNVSRVSRVASIPQCSRLIADLVGCASLFAVARSSLLPTAASASGNKCATPATILSRTGAGDLMWNWKETLGLSKSSPVPT
jgi:hypothetical protein